MVQVREVREAERRAVGDLRVAAFEAQDLLTGEGDYRRTLHALGADGSGRVLVAAEDERLLGTIMWQPFGPASEVARDVDEADVRALAVDPAARGRGVGALLVNEVVARAAAAGVQRLVLSTRPAMVGAQRLYRAAGFTRCPERDWTAPPGVVLLAYGRTIAGSARSFPGTL